MFFDIIKFKQSLKPDFRVMGLDVGGVRIGCALSDKGQFLATGTKTFNLKKEKISSAVFADLCQKEQVYGIVVGYPIQMDGLPGKACEMVDKFIEKYLKPLNQPIFLQDERLSSSAVSRFLKEMQVDKQKQQGLTDKAAASYILQTVLDKLTYLN
jgi:putative holliday junction resolvase